MKKEFIEKYEWTKENLSLILIIPTLIGGLWQIIELSSISVAYIRFFSITQVIPDGLLILFAIILTYGSYYIGSSVIKLTPIYKAKTTRWLSVILILFAIILISATSGYELYKTIKNIGYFSVSDIVFIVFSITFFSSMLVHLIPHNVKRKIFENLQKRRKNRDSEESEISNWRDFGKQLIASIILIIGFWSLLFVLSIVGDLRNSYVNTENLINIEYLKKQSSKNEKNKSFEKILYFNDKYFFIQLKDIENKKYIRVLKTEKMFETK